MSRVINRGREFDPIGCRWVGIVARRHNASRESGSCWVGGVSPISIRVSWHWWRFSGWWSVVITCHVDAIFCRRKQQLVSSIWCNLLGSNQVKVTHRRHCLEVHLSRRTEYLVERHEGDDFHDFVAHMHPGPLLWWLNYEVILDLVVLTRVCIEWMVPGHVVNQSIISHHPTRPIYIFIQIPKNSDSNRCFS